MGVESHTGLYGKLPAHGDFIQRNLPSSFINVWDEWMQHFIAGSKEQLGEEWLNIYLTSPIWRFVFSAGIVDENVWAGIMMPSVDRVGRYFPFSVATKLPGHTNPLEFINLQNTWYEKIEDIALQALDGQLVIEELEQELTDTEINLTSSYVRSGQVVEHDATQINMEFEEQVPASVYAYMLDSVMMQSFRSYSVWTTNGSERIEPCFFSVQGLPDVSRLPAMMDGLWSQWGWQQPYVLNSV